VPFADALACAADLRIIADAGGCALSEAAGNLPAGTHVAASILIGPEGGFSAEELARASAAGWACVRFHANILRAETAASVCCALVQYALEARR